MRYTKFIGVVLVEPILHKFEDLKSTNILNPQEVYFIVARVNLHFHAKAVLKVSSYIPGTKNRSMDIILY